VTEEGNSFLGTPLLTDVFHANRWDYYFSNVTGGKAAELAPVRVLRTTSW
jgi:outer membrane protein assembly factor BamE